MAGRFVLPTGEIGDFCRRWGITELAVFGSAARGELTPASDVDFLVTWGPARHWSLVDHQSMEEELQRIVGRSVDLVSRKAIEESENFVIRKHILASARTVYAA
jgi:uncharacterized protein